MFGFLRAAADRIDSLIAAGTRIEGEVVFTGGLRIDGDVRGNVVAAAGRGSILVIGATGRVQGEIRAERMVVSGAVAGSICVSGVLELLPGARVSGELRYGALEVQPGAVLEVTLRREVPVPTPATVPATRSTPQQSPERPAPTLIAAAGGA